MKTYFRFFVIFLVFSCWISYTASAQVVLIYTGNTHWITPAEATTEAGTTKSLLQVAGIQAEITENENRVKQWMLQTASDGSVNVLILYGVVPATIYPSGNAMPDGSVAEKWIETRDGNTILNHADYFGFRSTGHIFNRAGALQNLMDIPNISLFFPNIPMFVTLDGSTLTPSLVDFQSDRAFPLNQLQGDWFAEKILASNTGDARATLADPVVVRDGNRGRIAIVHQTDFEDNPNGEVAAEIIVNYLLADAGKDLIPDARLSAAVRKASGLASNAPITKQDIQKLTTLDADDRQIKDLTGLEHATQLETLRLWDNQIRDVSPLAGLTNLTGLYLNGNQISDFTPIAGLTKLRELGIGQNTPKIRDITVLRGLTQIDWLNLYDGQIRDISPLAELTQLESLYLERNQIRDVSPLARLTRLKDLRLAENNIRDVSALTGLVNLEKLLLAENPITDTSPLASLTKLRDVDIEISQPSVVVQVGASERPPMYWVNVTRGTLHRLVGAEVENLVPSVRNATSLAMDVAGSKLYWTEQTSNTTGRIRRANLDGRNVRLVKNLTSVPHDIALDAANGKIYVTNAWGKIQRLNVDGSNFQPNLITDLERPKGLALDVSGGQVYWTEMSGRIRRANLDGSNVEDVATGLGTPINIAIFDNTVYWTEKIGENSGEIRFVNLQGNVVTRNSFTQGFPVGIAVDAVERTFYWTTSHGKIGRQALDGSNFQPNFVTGLSAPGTLALRVETPMDVETPVVATTDAVVSVSPSPVISPAVGKQLTLNLNITAGEAVAGYQFIVRFDPTALRYVESGNGEYLPTGAFFVQPVVNRDRVELAATALAGVSKGDGTLATITFEVMAVKASTLTLSETLFADDQGNTSLPRVEGGEITEPPKLKGDVNADGVVNIQDLVLVASSFGETGENSADINADGVVNIADLVLVAGALGATAAAPSIQAESLKLLTAADVREWLSQAHRLNSSHVDYQRGLLVLEQLLAALAPKETLLLPNYPNPFNPETWIPHQLATSGDVKITIYDARGVVVRRLELGYRQAGYYTNRSRAAYWDGCNGLGEHVASGLYFYHLQAEGVSLLRKMVTLK